MGQDEAERLYALALALVEEPEAAADLLLHSPGEHDLRAGAARWRRQQGLKPTPREVAPPQLDPAQREFALHLARRGQQLRRTRLIISTLLGCLLLIGGAVLYDQGVEAAVRRVALPFGATGRPAPDPVFAVAPLLRSDPVQGLELAIYRAEARPGSVALWWELTGPNASRLAAAAAGGLTLDLAAPLLPGSTVLNHLRRNQVQGQSIFHLPNPPDWVPVRLDHLGPVATGWRFELEPVRERADLTARTYPVGEPLRARDSEFHLRDLRAGAHATVLQVEMIGHRQFRLPEVHVDGERLARQGIWDRADLNDGWFEVVLAPLPPAARQVSVTFPDYDHWTSQVVEIGPPPDPRIRMWKVDGNHLTAQLALTLNTSSDRPPWAMLLDEAGTPWPGGLLPLGQEDGTELWLLTAALGQTYYRLDLPSEPVVQRAAPIKKIQIWAPRKVPDPVVTIWLDP